MRGESLRTILDTSVTQTLSRTFITSGATLLTVIALFILTSGTIRNFALNMIVGIVEGTYSTFISAFIVIEWTKWREGKRKTGELKKYGIGASEKPLLPSAVDEEAVAEEPEPEMGEAPAGLVPESASGGAAALAAAQPASSVPQNVPFPGQTGSRKHKKHKRRHH
jgi:hypothetical protein